MKQRPIEWIENWVPAKIAKLDTPCWDCVSHTLNEDYPKIVRDGAKITAHRYIYFELFGILDNDMCVMHKCDNTRCINPQHLNAGTWGDNNRDTVLKKRHRCAKGEDHFNSKLTDAKVVFILKNKSIKSKELAKKFKVSLDTINLVKRRVAWRHVII